jgi:hypothetical protein
MIRRSGDRPLCAAGIRAWCDRHQVPWDQFTGAGVPLEQFEKIQDHYAEVLIALAKKELDDGQQ